MIKLSKYSKRRVLLIVISSFMLVLSTISYVYFEAIKRNTLPIELEIIEKHCGLRAAIFVEFKNEKRKISVSTNKCESLIIGSSHRFYHSKEFDYLRLESANNNQNLYFILLSLGFFLIAVLPIKVKDW